MKIRRKLFTVKWTFDCSRMSGRLPELGLLARPELDDARALKVMLPYPCTILIRRPDGSEISAEAKIMAEFINAPIEVMLQLPGWTCSITGIEQSEIPDGSDVFELEVE